MKKNKKLNNKGFSLVELIIVVAIMAVLVGVLAPQYLRHVETSRQSADLDNYETILSTVEIWAADPTNTWTDGTLTIAADGDITASGSVEAALLDYGIMTGATGSATTTTVIRSAAYQSLTVDMDRDATTGVIEYTFSTGTGEALQTALGR